MPKRYTRAYVANKATGFNMDLPGQQFYIGRGTPLGNKYHIGPDGTRREVVRKFRVWLYKQPRGSPAFQYLEQIDAAAREDTENGVVLVCHCAPEKCHGYVIARAIRGGYVRYATRHP